MIWPPPKIEGAPRADGAVEDPAAPGEARANAPSEPPPAGTSLPASLMRQPESLLGAVLAERYRVTALLGRGPTGIAYAGDSPITGSQVVIKILPRPASVPAERFAWQVRQALALAHFDHEHVSAIKDFGTLKDGSLFLIRPLAPGVTLRKLLRQGGLSISRALDIARQIAEALTVAHGQDIAHGRLKPENVIVLTDPGGTEHVTVVDFGMAELSVDPSSVAASEAEARRLALRTSLYLPDGKAGASPEADVFSLGVLLFEMIAGKPPFVFSASGQPGPPLSFAQCDPPLKVPSPVNDLVLGMMHPRARQHGIGAPQLVHSLNALLGRPSAAPPAPAAVLVTGEASAAPVGAEEDATGVVRASTVPPLDSPLHPGARGPAFDGDAMPPSGPPSTVKGAPSAELLHGRVSNSLAPLRPPPPSTPGVPTAAQAPRWALDAPVLVAPADAGSHTPPPVTSSVPPPPGAPMAAPTGAGPSVPPFGVASGTYPPQPPPASPDDDSDLDDDEMLRPGLFGRLKRLFGRKKSGF